EEDPTQLKVVILARNPAPSSIKALINQSLYKDRVTYLVGQGLDTNDLKRVQLQYASAAYIIADRNAPDSRLEDEHNTLRAWALDEFAPMTPLFVSNLLPESETYQEKATTAGSPSESYRDSWRAQYGDGSGNELYSTKINPVFIGHRFMDVCWYLYREFQVILIAVKVFIKSKNEHHHVLNPGFTYTFDEHDTLILIAESPEDLRSIQGLTAEEFQTSLKNDEGHSVAFGSLA
ncbi:hypothetical protein HDV05_002446, partial [Chytridiales sp. JEL 0842]